MPRVTVETVDHVARLARLSLTDEEKRLAFALGKRLAAVARKLAA